MRARIRQKTPHWARTFYREMSNFLSDLVLEGKASYRKINVYGDSGASLLIWQNKREVLEYGDYYKVDYPIEVWTENNATFNSLRPLFLNEEFPRINLISQKGFAKTNHIEALKLDRAKDVELILNLTDFDPSGYYMTEDLQNRLNQIGLSRINVKRIGILPQQIPPQKRVASIVTFKKGDTRAKKFIEEWKQDPLVQKGFGYEIQALNPPEIRQLVIDAINQALP